MGKTQYYKYNAETDNFERVFPTIRTRLWTFSRYMALSLTIGIMLFVIFYYSWGTPGEREMRQENAALKQQYEVLNRRLENALKVMDNIRKRDDDFYRVMLQMEPVDELQRYAGLNNEQRYRDLRNMSDGGMVKFVAQRMDLLERSIYAQSLSFDQLKQTARNSHDRYEHIPSILPVPEWALSISGGYGMRRDPLTDMAIFHSGIDISAKEGVPVVATADGKVSVSERRNLYGNYVEIDHGFNYATRYMHLSSLLVKEGQTVRRGDLIGRVGSTGKSTGPHLHYEVRFRNEPQNPVNYCFNSFGPEKYADMMQQADNAADIMD